MIRSCGPWVPGNWSAKKTEVTAPIRGEKTLQGPQRTSFVGHFTFRLSFVRYIYELHEKAISWFFPVPDNRKCEVDLCRSSVRNDSSFGARHLLMQSHPAAGGREQEVILLICGRISTQGVSFGREIDESCLHKSPVENGTAELSQDWSRDGHREVHHLAELVLCVCLHAYFCTTEGKQKYSLQIPSCPWSSLGQCW